MDCIGFKRFGTGRHGCWLVAWLFCFAGWTLAAGPPTPPRRTIPALPRPAPDGHRFLFVVDISEGMRATDAANRQALFDMLFTGLDGQMRTGDTFGLWLYNDKLHAGTFPMQIWDEKDPLPAASLATKFLRDQPYAGKSRPGVFMPPLRKLIEGVRDVNVLVISQCKPALQGTPFDTNIAAIVRRKRDERETAAKPFVTALVARKGEIVSGGVVIAGEAIVLPERPPPLLAARGTNSPTSLPSPNIANSSNSPAPPTKPKGIVNSISTSEFRVQGSELLSNSTKPPTIALEPGPATAKPEPATLNPEPPVQTTATLTPQAALPSKPKVLQFVTQTNVVPTNEVAAIALHTELTPTNLAAAPTSPTKIQNSAPGISDLVAAFQPGTRNPEPGTETAKPEPAITTTNTEPRQPANPAAAPTIPVAASVTSLVKALDAEPIPVAAREPASNDRTPATAAVVAPSPGPSSALLLTIGIVLFAACVGLLLLVLRRLRPRSQGSFITRSMELR